MHRGMIGDTLQPEHLVQPQFDENPDRNILRASPSFPGQQPIQCPLPARYPKYQLLAQSAIRRRKPVSRQLAIKQLFNVLAALFSSDQDARGNFSWTFFHYPLIMNGSDM